jgi:ABC-2 type transport system permease protein
VNSYNKRDLLTSLFSLPLVLTAPLFYSLESVPAYLKVLAALNPFTYAVLLVRSPSKGPFALLPPAGCTVAMLLIAGALVIASRRHELMSGEQG